MRFVFITILCMLFFSSCTEDAVTGVTDSGNYVTGKTVSLYEQIEGAKVYLLQPEINNDKVSYTIIDSAVTDSTGNWKITAEDGEYLLLSNGAKHAPALKRVSISHRKDEYSIVHFDNAKTVIGHSFLGESLDISDIMVSVVGTDVSATTDSTGQFILHDVPSGDIDLVYSTTLGNYVSEIQTVTENSLLYVRDIALPKEDEDTLRNSRYENVKTVTPIVYDAIPEYYYSMNFDGVEYSSFNNDEVDFSPEEQLKLASFDSETEKLFIHDEFTGSGLNSLWKYYIFDYDTLSYYKTIYGKGFAGNALYSEFIYEDSTKSTSSGSVTLFFDWVAFDSSNGSIDLTNVSTVNFFMKGQGTIKVILQDSYTMEHTNIGVSSLYEYGIDLKDQWNYYQIPIEDFVIGEPFVDATYYTDRKEVLSKVEYLKFMTIAEPGDHVTFWIDEISLSGVKLKDLQ